MWHWLIINYDFNVVRGDLYVNPPQNTPANATVQIRVVADMSGPSYCRELTVCFPWASGHTEGQLIANQYLRLHQHRAIMRAGFLFKITHGGLRVYARCICVSLQCAYLLWRCVHVLVCTSTCVLVSYVSHYRPQARLPPGPILISHLFSSTLPN